MGISRKVSLVFGQLPLLPWDCREGKRKEREGRALSTVSAQVTQMSQLPSKGKTSEYQSGHCATLGSVLPGVRHAIPLAHSIECRTES